MSNQSLTARRAALAGIVALVACAGFSPARGQDLAPPRPATSPVKFEVKGPSEMLEMTVNTSRVVEFPFDVPRMMVNNPELVGITPISPKSLQLSALRAGVTQLNVWNADGEATSIDLTILGNVQELEMTLKSLFPEASLRLRPLNSSLYISGYVPKAEMVTSVTNVARDYYPNIINDTTVGGTHKVLLHVKVMEVSRTKLRTLGFDWAQISGGSFVTQSVSQLLETPGNLGGNTGATVRFGVIDNGSFYGFLEALRQYDLAKLMAEPTLTTLDGRAASFNVGGEVPIPLQQSLGVTTVEYHEFGTRIDFVPMVLGNGVIRLEVRPAVTEVDPSLRDPVTGVPGFRTRHADTATELKAGQTMALAGLVYSREEAVNRGIPWLADVPWFGAPFRRVSNRRNEVELLIFVTPEFCEALDPCDVPPCGPGEMTTSPTDAELYGRGYMEVPKGAEPGLGDEGAHIPLNPIYEDLPPGSAAPAAPKAPNAPLPPPTSGEAKAGPPPKVSVATGRVRSSSGRTIGTGVSGSANGGTVKSSQPQNRTSSSSTNASGLQAVPRREPALIGPLGYDDLK